MRRHTLTPSPQERETTMNRLQSQGLPTSFRIKLSELATLLQLELTRKPFGINKASLVQRAISTYVEQVRLTQGLPKMSEADAFGYLVDMGIVEPDKMYKPTLRSALYAAASGAYHSTQAEMQEVPERQSRDTALLTTQEEISAYVQEHNLTLEQELALIAQVGERLLGGG